MIVIRKHGVEQEAIGPPIQKDFLTSVELFLHENGNYKFILNHFCIECKFSLLRHLRYDLNKLANYCIF